MSNEQRCISNVFPVRINPGLREVTNFLNDLRLQCPDVHSFLTAVDIHNLARGASRKLLELELPSEVHVGAAYIHVALDRNVDQVVRQSVRLHFKLGRDGWRVDRAYVGLVFPLQTQYEGIQLNWRQKSVLLSRHAQSLRRLSVHG